MLWLEASGPAVGEPTQGTRPLVDVHTPEGRWLEVGDEVRELSPVFEDAREFVELLIEGGEEEVLQAIGDGLDDWTLHVDEWIVEVHGDAGDFLHLARASSGDRSARDVLATWRGPPAFPESVAEAEALLEEAASLEEAIAAAEGRASPGYPY